MRICIGILARNEADRIGALIADLDRQTLFRKNDISMSLCVVANGCTDATVEVARNALSDTAFVRQGRLASVHSLAQAGKSNAWNEFIHKIAPRDTDYVFLLDADIRIPEHEALQRMLDRLTSSKGAVVAIGKSTSDLSLRRPKNLAELLIKAGTGKVNDPQTALSGAFYCACYAELGKIWMPTGLPVENGFLRAMIMTSSFLQSENPERLVFVDGAQHIFESERSVRAVFRHNVRLRVGTALNVLLFNHLRKLSAEGVDLSRYIYERNHQDPSWLNSLVDEELKRSAFFVVHKGALSARWGRFRGLRLKDRLKELPMLCVGVVFETILFVRANTLMRRRKAAGFWWRAKRLSISGHT